jgi:hypothetical protein
MTPLVAFKESNRPQDRFAFADGKLQLSDKSCQAHKLMAFGLRPAWFQTAATFEAAVGDARLNRNLIHSSPCYFISEKNPVV